MSILADKTERKALVIIASMVKQYEKLHYLSLSKSDDWDVTAARNLLEGIIQSNGYKINYDRSSPRSIVKLKI